MQPFYITVNDVIVTTVRLRGHYHTYLPTYLPPFILGYRNHHVGQQ